MRIAFKQNPLPFHKDALPAAEASLAAAAQGKFWEMHDKLFQNTRELKRENLEKYAQELGLDLAKFKAFLDQHTAKAQIDEEQALAKKFGARGTPATFINGNLLSGAQPFEKFKAAIDTEIAEADKLLKQGTKPAEVYAARLKANLKEAPAAAARKPERKQRPQKDPNAVYKVPVEGAPVHSGPPDALVTIAEITDYQ